MSTAAAQIEDDVEALYRATSTPRMVRVPSLRFMCLDGRGDPETSAAYSAAIRALYAVAYTSKHALRTAGEPVDRVPPLECLWSAEDPAAFVTGRKADWNWTLMLRTPAQWSTEIFETSRADAAARKAMPTALLVTLKELEEGTAAQVLHVGPYDAEGPTIQRLHDFITEQGFTFDDPALCHHEIYLGDPRRCAPERLRTILRQPCVEKKVTRR